MQDTLEAPKLTLPPEEAAAVAAAYAAAQVILEYGSGGSTLLAAENARAKVFSVESDAAWVEKMRGWFASHPAKAQLVLHHADIGPTKDWGMPANHRHVRQWAGYPNSVWDLPGFVQPDTVLIDGRFRLACFLTVLLRSTAPVTVLWDDYTDRPAYHQAEKLLKPARFHGRMAVFELTPQPLAPADLGWVAEAFATPQ
jgi:hypothetical protein